MRTVHVALLLLCVLALAVAPIAHATQDHVAYVGSNQHIYEAFETSSTSPVGDWQTVDVTASAGAPLAALNSGLAEYFIDSEELIYYIGANQHVYDLYNANGWHFTDQTAQTGAPLAEACSAPCTAFSPVTALTLNAVPYVYYVGTDLHIHESWGRSNIWHVDDPTALSGAPPVGAGSGLISFRIDSEILLYFLSADGHVHEVKNNGGGWIHTDITNASRGPAGAVAAIAGFSYGLQAHVYYFVASGCLPGCQGTAYDVHELYSNDGSPWIDEDVTANAALSHQASSPATLTSFVSKSYYHVVYAIYGSGGYGLLEEAYRPGTGYWVADGIGGNVQVMDGSPLTNAPTPYYVPVYFLAPSENGGGVGQTYTASPGVWPSGFVSFGLANVYSLLGSTFH